MAVERTLSFSGPGSSDTESVVGVLMWVQSQEKLSSLTPSPPYLSPLFTSECWEAQITGVLYIQLESL
jgi:hypothetical protein